MKEEQYQEGVRSIVRDTSAPVVQPQEQKAPTEKIDGKKMIIYSAILNPKFEEN